MKELRHPLTNDIYGICEESGLVRVTRGNMTGLYTMRGEWHSGDIFDVCMQMCMWVGGPNPSGAVATSFRQM